MKTMMRTLLPAALAILSAATAHAQRNVYNQKALPWSSYVSPALRWFNCRLYIAWTGTDHGLYISSSADGTSFSSPVKLNEYSYLSPALAADSTGTLYVAWT